MARRPSLNKRSMTPAQWRMPFWEDPMYPFAQNSPSLQDTAQVSSDMPDRPVAKKTTKTSFGKLKSRYRTP